MRNLFNFKQNILGLTKMETIEEPKESVFDKNDNNTVQKVNTNDNESIINKEHSSDEENSSNTEEDDNLDQDNDITNNISDTNLKSSKTIINIEPSKEQLDSNMTGKNSSNCEENLDDVNQNSYFSFNNQYDDLSFTETCMYKALNVYVEISNFFFSMKENIVDKFNYYFRPNTVHG